MWYIDIHVYTVTVDRKEINMLKFIPDGPQPDLLRKLHTWIHMAKYMFFYTKFILLCTKFIF